MSFVNDFVTKAPEIFLFLAMALGTTLGRVRIRGFAIGSTACILIVAVILGQLGPFSISPLLRSILFGLFVFTVGYRAGPEFFASLSIRTLGQVALALIIGATGLAVVLGFASLLHLDSGTAAGLAAGALTQSAMLGTASGALAQIDLPQALQQQQQANIAAGYAVTYILGYILVLFYVPFGAPLLMGVNLKKEAARLEAELYAGAPPKTGTLLFRKFQARAYVVSAAAGQTVKAIEDRIGGRVVVERILRGGLDVELKSATVLERGDEILIAGPTTAIIACEDVIGQEIAGEHVMLSVPGEVLEVLVNAADLHGRSLADVVDRLGETARGVFLRSLQRHGQEVPVTPSTRIYVGDVMTLVGRAQDVNRAAARVGQVLHPRDRIDSAFLAYGLAAGLLVGYFSFAVGTIPLTLGGAGGALIAGLVCGWLHSHRPNVGAIPPAAQQTLVDVGLGGFIAAIGLVHGPAAIAAVQAHGVTLLLVGMAVTLLPMIVGTLFAHRVLRMEPPIICGAVAGAMTVDAAVTGACEAAESQTPVLGVAVPYAIANVILTVLGPIIVGVTSVA